MNLTKIFIVILSVLKFQNMQIYKSPTLKRNKSFFSYPPYIRNYNNTFGWNEKRWESYEVEWGKRKRKERPKKLGPFKRDLSLFKYLNLFSNQWEKKKWKKRKILMKKKNSKLVLKKCKNQHLMYFLVYFRNLFFFWHSHLSKTEIMSFKKILFGFIIQMIKN